MGRKATRKIKSRKTMFSPFPKYRGRQKTNKLNFLHQVFWTKQKYGQTPASRIKCWGLPMLSIANDMQRTLPKARCSTGYICRSRQKRRDWPTETMRQVSPFVFCLKISALPSKKNFYGSQDNLLEEHIAANPHDCCVFLTSENFP
jgi:hypothetical protein